MNTAPVLEAPPRSARPARPARPVQKLTPLRPIDSTPKHPERPPARSRVLRRIAAGLAGCILFAVGVVRSPFREKFTPHSKPGVYAALQAEYLWVGYHRTALGKE